MMVFWSHLVIAVRTVAQQGCIDDHAKAGGTDSTGHQKLLVDAVIQRLYPHVASELELQPTNLLRHRLSGKTRQQHGFQARSVS